MQASTDRFGPSARRKCPIISCRECHRRKEKCDRRQPCIRCVRRGKRNACVYELHDVRPPPLPAEVGQQPTDTVLPTPSETTLAASSTVEDESRLLGYANNAKGTPGLIRGLGEIPSQPHTSRSPNDATTSQYVSLVRGLPSRRHIDILVKDFFQNVAWHYDFVDQAIFMTQLSQWNSLSYRQLQQAPDGLPTRPQAFPALLFQVLAQALLFQPRQHDESLNDLKYAADMELSDRATECSDAGHRIASSFRKSELTLSIVQAELMRACFEKTTGAVVDAWHTLGVAIRDAQELGLHQLKPKQNLNESSDCELGRKVWLMLHLWDAHMGIVLGRPISTRVHPDDVAFPTPCNPNSDTVRPRDVILCGYHTAYKFLQDIHDLERIDDCNLLVETLHETLLANISNLPAWAKPQRSRHCEPPWLSTALETMYTNVYFVLFALHRPFVFVNPTSRARAFHAAMQILESQARLFDKTEPLQHRAFSLVFATFDAMVLIVAIQIRFPEEFASQLPATKTNLEWALERLKMLRASNRLAGSAFTSVQRLYRRMVAVVSPPTQQGPCSGVGGDSSTGLEGDVQWVDWDTFLQPDLGDVIPPLPFNQLLYDGALDVDPAWQTQPDHEIQSGLSECP